MGGATVIPGKELLARLATAEERVEYLRDKLVVTAERCRELKRQRDNMQTLLREARQSRDMWKERALAYQARTQVYRQRSYYARKQRDNWKFRALQVEVAQNPTPNGKGWLTRVSK